MGSYNLLNEKWIKVLDTDGQSREVSLKELIGQAHRFSWFAHDAGALPGSFLSVRRKRRGISAPNASGRIGPLENRLGHGSFSGSNVPAVF